MPYDWISLLFEAVLLLNEVSFNGRFTCDMSSGHGGIYRFADADTAYHTLTVRDSSTGAILFSRDFLPWCDFGFNANTGTDTAALPVHLVTVTDF